MTASGIAFTLYLSILQADMTVRTWAMEVYPTVEACLDTIDENIQRHQEFYKPYIAPGSMVRMRCVPGQNT